MPGWTTMKPLRTSRTPPSKDTDEIPLTEKGNLGNGTGRNGLVTSRELKNMDSNATNDPLHEVRSNEGLLEGDDVEGARADGPGRRSNARQSTIGSLGGRTDVGDGIEDTGVYRVYKRRWFGLAQVVLLNIVVSWDVSNASFGEFHFHEGSPTNLALFLVVDIRCKLVDRRAVL